jgi:tRNA A37 methylthiotransferase MiaB
MRFAVKFLGCKVSHADAMLARQALLEAGHAEAPEEQAELHVINTCCGRSPFFGPPRVRVGGLDPVLVDTG